MSKPEIPVWTVQNTTHGLCIAEDTPTGKVVVATLPKDRMDEAKIMRLAPELLQTLNEVMKAVPALTALVGDVQNEELKKRGAGLINAMYQELEIINSKL